jgi:stearoyl-CoA desaturase (delta-9 desaturase)
MSIESHGATAGEAASGAFRVHSLSGLDRASAFEGRVVWDAPRSLWNIGMFGAAITFAPATFGRDAFAIFLLTSAITLCAGHSVGFHRRMIHRSFDCPKWLEYLLIYFGTLVGMGGPVWTIRLHDTRDWAQRQTDCHWFLRHGLPMPLEGLTYLNLKLELARPPHFDPGRDITGDRFYRFMQATWMAQQLPLAAVLYALGGWPWVVWGIFVRVATCTTMHWLISYLAHTGGPDDWSVDDAAIQASNVGWLAIPTMGEAWHGNHHAFPSSARHGLYPGQIDLGWLFIRVLALFGLATNIKTPATLPRRSGLTPLTQRAITAAPAQR